MSGQIQINEAIFNVAMTITRASANGLLSSQTQVPSYSSTSKALDKYKEKMFAIGVLAQNYKTLLEKDLEALEAAKNTIIEADEKVAQSLKG